ncbi:Tricarballylate dehydrogenase [Methylocella tundrae]|uniref:Tricarballylate dehydrogenase n=1 Tax=Methylocella tundrae TaxID=227605 RepID=A0A8B6MA17_METTU|nr:FAD-dependent tricarballylate dehydrogenase TcuA [Methylocella tundrae]VTZ51135.1 Tricarballylate dehydrogenase [Methylocella tundrae]
MVIVGAGNAAMCAALSAREQGASVTVLERAPENQKGGNSAFTGAAFRVAYNGVADLLEVVPDLTTAEQENSDFGEYTQSQYFDDLARLSQYRMDAELGEILVSDSLDTLVWMRRYGVRFVPIYGRQAFKVDGRFHFWGGLTVEVSGGGRGLVDSLHAAAGRQGIEILYGARAISLVMDGQTTTGVKVIKDGHFLTLEADAVILASGGFHANAEWRARYLGENWDLAKVRGSRFNTGDGIRMALDVGAQPYGHWSGCHAVAYDRNAPEFGELDLLGQQKNGFPFGIMVNARGERFFDEGADFRNYTYSKLGKAILEQPGGIAWQVFDQRVAHLLSDEYRIRQITRVEAATLEELAAKLEDVDSTGFLRTVAHFNASVRDTVAFNPNVKDGRSTDGLETPKSNWANPLDTPPFIAFGVACGITFTFGGLRIDSDSRVLTPEGDLIRNLYAAGELVGGLYYVSYPGGAGLMSGSVFGRRAGAHAARGC